MAWLDATLDAEDARSRRMWRHAVLGADVATIMSQRPGSKQVSMFVPMAEFALLRGMARSRGDLSATAYIRSATATALIGDGVPPEVLPWMGKYGLWTPS